MTTTPPALDLEPSDVFTRLVREVQAGQLLVGMAAPTEARNAALDALALARDVLDDARQLLEPDPELGDLDAAMAAAYATEVADACATDSTDGWAAARARREALERAFGRV